MILIDPSAGSGHLLSPFKRLNHGQARHERLVDIGGDVAFTGNGPSGLTIHIGIEVKTIWDLADCIHSGRLTGHQIPLMKDYYNEIYLVVINGNRTDSEGFILVEASLPVRPGSKRRKKTWIRMSRRGTPSGSGYVLSHTVSRFLEGVRRFGVHVIQCADETTAIDTIYQTYCWWQKRWEEHEFQPIYTAGAGSGAKAFSPVTMWPTAVQMFSGAIPNVKDVLARRLAERYKTPLSLCLASEKELAEIDGIGKTKARELAAFLQDGIVTRRR